MLVCSNCGQPGGLVHAVESQLAEIERLRAGLLEIRRRLKDMPGVTCGMDDVIDHALPPLNEQSESDDG